MAGSIVVYGSSLLELLLHFKWFQATILMEYTNGSTIYALINYSIKSILGLVTKYFELCIDRAQYTAQVEQSQKSLYNLPAIGVEARNPFLPFICFTAEPRLGSLQFRTRTHYGNGDHIVTISITFICFVLVTIASIAAVFRILLKRYLVQRLRLEP
ncbi:hypothetical protein BV898_12813 [Hypsibius exemplaris]|uniref:Uncharacterized protein n=1 Tax=Hypsibius exemplaris TaxID=2072580 RepID=A0A1W0WCF8_HYPEX|nr:hypothetical protein BV898_12813 [Hypsibius exemplaris]